MIIGEYYNTHIRKIFRLNNNVDTSIVSTTSSMTLTTSSPLEDTTKINCKETLIYCNQTSDCLQLCARPFDTVDKITYKCTKNNICIQSPVNIDDSTIQSTIPKCNRKFGFYPVLTADELFQSEWKCLNTLPHIFSDKTQDFHPYICAGGDRSKLDPANLFESCICNNNTIGGNNNRTENITNKIKVRDEFRTGIPICVEKHQLALFPNFTY